MVPRTVSILIFVHNFLDALLSLTASLCPGLCAVILNLAEKSPKAKGVWTERRGVWDRSPWLVFLFSFLSHHPAMAVFAFTHSALLPVCILIFSAPVHPPLVPEFLKALRSPG